MKQLNQILSELMTDGTGIKRVAYLPFKIDVSLKVVNEIGNHLLKDFSLDERFRRYYIQLIKYFHADQSFDGDLSKGLLITGPTGTGKSLSMEVMKYYRGIDDIKFLYNNKPAKFDYRLLTGHTINHSFMQNGYDGIQTFINESVLYLDDFGTEERIVSHYGSKLDAVEYVLMERHRKEKLTFATSNLNIKQLKDIYGDRLYSRYKQMFNLITLTGEDLRK